MKNITREIARIGSCQWFYFLNWSTSFWNSCSSIFGKYNDHFDYSVLTRYLSFGYLKWSLLRRGVGDFSFWFANNRVFFTVIGRIYRTSRKITTPESAIFVWRRQQRMAGNALRSTTKTFFREGLTKAQIYVYRSWIKKSNSTGRDYDGHEKTI